MSIEVKELSKFYGTQKALNNISFSVKKGEIVGFLGPNGAGKSTLMKILTTYVKASEGHAKVSGFDVEHHKQDVQRHVGYLPEHNPLYLDMYVKEYLAFNAGVYNIPKTKITEVIELTGLTAESHKKISALSKGYRQRVGLANALLHDPSVLILDEPTTHLDIYHKAYILKLLQRLAKENNKTILFSSHEIDLAIQLCDKLIIMTDSGVVSDQPYNLINNGVFKELFPEDLITFDERKGSFRIKK